MAFTGSSCAGSVLQLQESSHCSPAFSVKYLSFLLVIQKLFNWLSVVYQEELFKMYIHCVLGRRKAQRPHVLPSWTCILCEDYVS